MNLSIVVIYSREDINFLPDLLSTLPDNAEKIFIETVQGEEESIKINRRMTDTNNPDNVMIDGVYTYTKFRFDKARNMAKSIATKDWILSLDADERLLIHQHGLIEKYINQVSKETGVIQMNVINPYMYLSDLENGCVHNISPVARLFRKDIDFRFPIHENIQFDAIEKGYEFAISELCIHHLGYWITKEEFTEKTKRNLDMFESIDYNDVGCTFNAEMLIYYADKYKATKKLYNELKETDYGS